MVNSADADSQTIANHYVHLRQIPPANVMYLDWRGPQDKTDINTFRDKILVPVLNELDCASLPHKLIMWFIPAGFPGRSIFLAMCRRRCATTRSCKTTTTPRSPA